MFDITQSAIDHGYGRCGLTGHTGIFCGEHCEIFNTCTVKSAQVKQKQQGERHIVKLNTANGTIVELPMTDEMIMEAYYNTVNSAPSNPAPKQEEVVKEVIVEDNEEIATTKVEQDANKQQEDANNAAANADVNELVDDVVEEEYDEDADKAIDPYDMKNVDTSINGQVKVFTGDPNEIIEKQSTTNQQLNGTNTSHPTYNESNGSASNQQYKGNPYANNRVGY